MALFCISLLLAILTAAPAYGSTVCQTSLHGTCVNLLSGSSHCAPGNHLVLSYCEFLEGCCYGPHHTSPVITPAPTHGSGSTGAGTHPGSSGDIMTGATCGAGDAHSSGTPDLAFGFCEGTCGVSLAGTSRIVGGTIATAGEYPWQISLRYNGQHMCGGTLIDKQWVMTAAHCFEHTSRSYWTVAAGINDRGHIYTNQIHRAVTIIPHERYDKRTHHNDITLVKLERPLDIVTSNVRTACLPSPHEDFDNTVCTATGWGTTYLGGQVTRYLEKINLPIIKHSLCRYIMGPSVIDSNICAGYTGGHGVCKGDSGGPLECKKNGRWTVAGITSWGYGCAEEHTPGVYTRVSDFLDWIHSTMRRH